jgi:hypothetical protein
MRTWLTLHRARVAGKSPLGEALAYLAKYWNGLCAFLTAGRVEIDNNAVESAIKTLSSPAMAPEPRTGRRSPRWPKRASSMQSIPSLI